MATPLDDIVEIYDYEVANKAIDGGDGQDTLQLVGGGYFIFPQAESLTNLRRFGERMQRITSSLRTPSCREFKRLMAVVRFGGWHT
jgi:hypothetical protein